MMRIPIIFKAGIAIVALLILTTCSKLSVNRNAPDMPSLPAPANGGTLDSLSIELSWTCSDPDGDPLSYDVYLDTSSAPEVLIATVDTTSYAPTGLRYNTIYYWQVIATDTTGMFTEGPVWSFGFGADMTVPACSLISPNGGELWYIGADHDITWEASDDDSIDYFILEYSIDNGNNWTALGDTLGGGDRSTSWSIPSSPSLQCMIAITCTDFGGNVAGDTSDAIFTIWPQGGMIAFSSDRDYTGIPSIFTMYANGNNPLNITNMTGPDYDVDVDWSPDCSRFVYRKHINSLNDDDIFVMNFDGSGQTNITNSPTTNDAYPVWSPQGDRIAFSSVRGGTDSDIWLMDPDGTNLTILTSTSDYQDTYPSWSPSGDQIVFMSNRATGGYTYDIYTMNSDGSNLQRLTTDPGHDAWASWSPDGLLIAFCTSRHGESEIYTMNANGSNPQRVTNNTYNDFWPRWSPDGRILFMSYRTGDWEIWVMDVDGGNPVNLSNYLGSDTYGAWSPIH